MCSRWQSGSTSVSMSRFKRLYGGWLTTGRRQPFSSQSRSTSAIKLDGKFENPQ